MSKTLLIYTMKYCPYCEMAKRLAKNKGFSFKEELVDDNDDATWDRLEKETGFKTMPQIFIVDDSGTRQFIGGYREFSHLDALGKLDELMK